MDDFDIDRMLEESMRNSTKEAHPQRSPTPERLPQEVLKSPPKSSEYSSRSRDRSRDRHSHKKRDRRSDRHHSRDRHSKTSHKKEPKKTPSPEPTPEEKDARTVFLMQLGPRVRERDIEDFFYEAGKVRDVRLIMDPKSRRSKGIAYVEFSKLDSVDNAVKMTGLRLCGRPVVVQYSQADKNRSHINAPPMAFSLINKGPMKLYISNLHPNVNSEMLESVFVKYGRINDLKIFRDRFSGKSEGIGHVTFASGEDARKVVDQLNGYDFGGKKMRLSYVCEGENRHDMDHTERGGVELGVTGKMNLMKKLAEGTGLNVTENSSGKQNYTAQGEKIDTCCLILMNMFDHEKETQPNWGDGIRDDIIEESDKHGGCVHLFIEIEAGNVFVKCPSVSVCISLAKALHGRFYGGRSITAHFIPLTSYHTLFPEAIPLKTRLKPASSYENNSFRIGTLHRTF